jgi:hypothetical protein
MARRASRGLPDRSRRRGRSDSDRGRRRPVDNFGNPQACPSRSAQGGRRTVRDMSERPSAVRRAERGPAKSERGPSGPLRSSRSGERCRRSR